MTTQPVTLFPHDTVAAALALLLKHRQLALPIVGDDRSYRGMFLRSLLLKQLLPRIVRMEDELSNVARIVDAMAAGETMADLRARYQAVAKEPVEKYSDSGVPVLSPTTPLINTVHLLHRARTILPVVEKETGRLVGVVSAWDLLDRLSAQS